MRLVALCLLLAACPGPATPVAGPAPGAAADAAPAAAAVPDAAAAAAEPTETPVDRGAFTLFLQGKPVGRETFTITHRTATDELIVRTDTTLATLHITGELVTDPTHHPRAGTFTIDTGKGKTIDASVATDPATGVLVQTLAGQETRAPAAVDLLISNNVMTHLQPICSLAGPKPVALVAFPGAKLAVEAAKPAVLRDDTQSGAPERAFTTVGVDFAGQIRMTLLCDGAHLVAVSAPFQAFVAVREGWEPFARPMLAPDPPKAKKPPKGLTELHRTVSVAAATDVPAARLDCTLLLPATHAKLKKPGKGKKAPLPAIIFLTGSGPQDRDEDSPGAGGLKLHIFQTIAFRLGQAGVASLRCDDRGIGKSTGSAADTTLITLVADARAMLAALRAEPAVDRARTGILGHSEGGMVAPMVAAVDPDVRALLLMAAPGRPLDTLIVEQVGAALARSGLSDAEMRPQLARLRAIFAALRAGKPAELSADERAAYDSPWLRSHLAHDPAALAATLAAPAIFIAQGGKDVQVRLADSEALADAFARAGNKRVVYQIYPELNHLFAAGAHGDLSDYADPDAHLDEGFLADLVKFARDYL